MKQLLPAAFVAIAIHGLLFIMDVPWANRAPVKPVGLKTISVVLTRENTDKEQIPTITPVPKPLVPLDSERFLTPAPTPPEKTANKRAEEKKNVPVEKKKPMSLPPSAVEASPELPKVIAEKSSSVPDAVTIQKEINETSSSKNEMPIISTEGASTPPRAGGNMSDGSLTSSNAGGNAVDARPLYKNNPSPRYPDIARKRNIQGTVVILALVNEKGGVEEARVDTSSGHAVLDNAAVTAVKSWEFEPGRRGINPVKSLVKLPITFQLK